MINIDSLPKSIKYNGNLYFLHLGVTAWNKIVVCYQYAFSPREALDKNIEYSILSQVVEPDCKGIRPTDEVTDIVDVMTSEEAFNTLGIRLYAAIDNGAVEVYKA